MIDDISDNVMHAISVYDILPLIYQTIYHPFDRDISKKLVIHRQKYHPGISWHIKK